MPRKNNGQQGKRKMHNKNRWRTYQLAYDHIDEAIKQGFYIEALVLEEGIIADRLGAAVQGKGIATPGKTLLLGKLIELVWQHSDAFQDLHERLAKKGVTLDDVDAWREERNKFIHNVAHGLPEQKTPVTADDYNARGTAVAERGLKLARLVCTWSQSELRAAKG